MNLPETKYDLSAQEIEFLKSYTLERGISYTDIQIELVDHLATAIEGKISKFPDLDFDQALYQVMLDFPHTGFYHFENVAKKTLREYWEKKFKSYIYQYFKLPKIISFLAITALLFQIFSWGGTSARNLTFFIVLGTWLIYALKEFFFGLNNNYHRKSFLFIRKYYEACANVFLGFGMIPFYISDVTSFGETMSLSASLVFALFLGIELVILYGIWFEFPKYLKSDIELKYGHLNLKVA